MRRPNRELAEYMARAGMRPPRLVAEINALLGDGYVSRSTVSEWLHAGRVPREPLPAVIAALLSEATGSRIRVSDLWPGACLTPTWAIPADDGLYRIARAPSPATALARDWVTHAAPHGGNDRRRFIPMPPGQVGFPVVPSIAVAAVSANGPWSTAAQATATGLARLPNQPSAVRYAHRQVLAFSNVLLEEGNGSDQTAALLVVVHGAAEVAEQAGETGLAQRYRAGAALLLPGDGHHARQEAAVTGALRSG